MRFSCSLFAVLCVVSTCAADRVVIVDAGHGGTQDVDESSPNNATSPSGVKEKDLTLEVARAVFEAIRDSSVAKKKDIVPILTRDRDVNVGMGQRAKIAHSYDTRAFVSIHFNASGRSHNAFGPLGLVQSAEHGNTDFARDRTYAAFLADAVSSVTRRYDARSKSRGAITDRELKGGRGSFLLKYLRATPKGRSFPSCFLEIDFIDNPAVEAWLVKGDKAKAIRAEIARAVATALIEYVSKD